VIVSPHVATGVAPRGGYRVVGFVLAIWEKPPPENAGSSVGSEGARPGIPFEREQNVGHLRRDRLRRATSTGLRPR
jgi:hypothetical protein